MEKIIQSSAHYANQTVSQIVTENYRAAAIFKEFGINYCCAGNISLREACDLKGLDTSMLSEKLAGISSRSLISNDAEPAKWKLSFLLDYIQNIHHGYLRSALPRLNAGLTGFANSHQKKMPYLAEILLEFQKLSNQLSQEMIEEEEHLFPYIRQVETAWRRNESYGNLLVKTLGKSLQPPYEHEIKSTLEHIRTLTKHYQFPENACTNHRVMFQLLDELDRDIQQHKRLELDILFPKAVDLEQSLLETAGVR